MDKRYNPNNTSTHRQCADCQRILPRSEFPIARSKSDGVFNYCRDCLSKRNSEGYKRNKEKIAQRRYALKTECANMLDGKCKRCGYNEFMAGLDFHHIGNKENAIASLITRVAQGDENYRSALMLELSKCILLCRNCHSAYHAGEWS